MYITPESFELKIIGITGIIYKIYFDNVDDVVVYELKKKICEKFSIQTPHVFNLAFNGKILDVWKKLSDYCVASGCYLNCVENSIGGGGPYFQKEINIKFIKHPKDINKSCLNQSEEELYGLLKLCFLKEISIKINENQIKKLPESISYILEILKNGYIATGPKEDIKKILEKIKGSNILNFSKFVDKTINSSHLKTLLQFLNKDDYEKINDIKRRLLNYNEYIRLFEKDFNERKRKSIFEFSIISMVIMEREDFQKFENERKKCENRVDRILYHGTSIESISCILTGYFKKSIERCYQHGKGVYFLDILDYNWFYGGEKNNRSNVNKIPEIDETFTLIACSTYYNKNGFRKVNDWKYTPKKNEINFAYANSNCSTIKDYPDESKFYGTEYVIWDLNQICPFITAKLKRKEFCVE